jgi:hypothetical protein
VGCNVSKRRRNLNNLKSYGIYDFGDVNPGPNTKWNTMTLLYIVVPQTSSGYEFTRTKFLTVWMTTAFTLRASYGILPSIKTLQ